MSSSQASQSDDRLWRVLIVGDEEPIRHRMADIFRSEGFCVDCAATSGEGIRKALEDHPDIVICDMLDAAG